MAWINAAFGAGVILGGLILSVWGGFKRRIYTSMLGIVCMAIGVLMIGLAPSNGYWLALVGKFIVATFTPAVRSFEDGHPTLKGQSEGLPEPQAVQEQDAPLSRMRLWKKPCWRRWISSDKKS